MLLSPPVFIHLLVGISFSFSVGVHCSVERDTHSSEKYVVIIIFRMAIFHLFPCSSLLLPHSWCREAGWERTVVGVQGDWRTVCEQNHLTSAGGCEDAECDSEQTSALTRIVFWRASYFTITVFLPSLCSFDDFPVFNSFTSAATNYPQNQHATLNWVLVKTTWLDYQKLMVSDTISIQT